MNLREIVKILGKAAFPALSLCAFLLTFHADEGRAAGALPEMTVHWATFNVFSTDWDALMKEVRDKRSGFIAGNLAAVARDSGDLNKRLADNLASSKKKYPNEVVNLDNGAFRVLLSYQVGPPLPRTSLNCFVLNVNITGSVTIYEPKWINYSGASPKLKKRWDRFFDMLERQQQSSVSEGLRSIKAEEKELEKTKDVDCSLIEPHTIYLFYEYVKKETKLRQMQPDITELPEFAPQKKPKHTAEEEDGDDDEEDK